uniref:Sushi domain-containing protein n=1 Tax=Mola mola TaxID=94237 RepID=A0A3Q3VVL9_MOLML
MSLLSALIRFLPSFVFSKTIFNVGREVDGKGRDNKVIYLKSNRGSFPPGTLLTYGCEPGYITDGPTSIICTSSGVWSPQPPRCIRSNICSPPTEPENGGYRCHPSPCHRLTQKTVIEYFCDEGYALKGDYKFLTCQNGEWDGPMQISCRLTQGLSEPTSPLGIPAFSIVASTASSVMLILLLVVLFVLVQPKLKSFHHNSLLSVTSTDDFSDGKKRHFFFFLIPRICFITRTLLVIMKI